MTMRYIGIDPGLDGAVAVIIPNGKVVLYDTPTLTVKRASGKKREYIAEEMAAILAGQFTGQNTIACIEVVHAMPKQGVASSFSFGKGFGIWIGIIAALKIPHRRVEPAVWKKAVGIPVGADKSESIVVARRLFPTAELTKASHHGRADALLLAYWLSRQNP